LYWGIASILTGWSEPKLTKTWATPASHNASKKANEAVYMLDVRSVSFYIRMLRATYLGGCYYACLLAIRVSGEDLGILPSEDDVSEDKVDC
jgi:hypothetical protein